MRGRLGASELERRGVITNTPQVFSPALSAHHSMEYTRPVVVVPFDR